MALHSKSPEGRLEAAASLFTRYQVKGGSVRWSLAGIAAGLVIWILALPFLGDPRISYRMTPVEGAGLPILVARSSFGVVSGADVPMPARRPGLNDLPNTSAESDLVQPVLWAMAMPEVVEALGLQEHSVSASGEGDPSDSIFSDPETLPPGGAPSVSLAQLVNPTDKPLQGELRPTVMVGDARLCRALRVAVVAMESGMASRHVIMAGSIPETAQEPVTPLVMDPGKAYELAILVTLPPDLPNDFQGVSCTVNFLMHFAEVM